MPTRRQASNPRHVEAEQYSSEAPTENPLGNSFNITVSVPDRINIKMVDASILEDYETWVFIASLLSNAVVGFVVAYFQAIDSEAATRSHIGWTAIIFVALCVISLITAFRKRYTLRKAGRDITLKTAGAAVRKKSS